MLLNMRKQGFDDALRFLNRNNLINCTRRITVKSTFVVPETIESNYADSDDQVCVDCTFHREVC